MKTMTKIEAVEYIVKEHGLNKIQAKKVWKQWKENNKKLEIKETLDDYLKPMLETLKELTKLGEFKEPLDKADGKMVKQNIKLDIEDEVIRFSVMHNIPNDYGFNLQNRIEDWIYKTDNFTADPLSKFVNDREQKYKIEPIEKAN